MTLNTVRKSMIDPEFVQEVQGTTNKIGILSELKTTNKADIVKSVNEVATSLDDKATKTQAQFLTQNITFNSGIRRPMVSFIDDDINKVVKDRLFPLYQSKGIVGSVAAITSKIGAPGYLTEANLHELDEAYWEILGHTYSHNPNLSIYPIDSDLDYELGEGCKGVLEKMGFMVDGFVYPQGVSDPRIRSFTKKYYTYSFGANGVNNEDFVDSMRIKRIPLGSFFGGDSLIIDGNSEGNTFAFYKACVDNAIRTGGWLVFMTHCSATANGMDENQWAIISQLLDYINTVDIDVVTPREGYKHFGNKIFVGDLDENYYIVNEKGTFQSRLDGTTKTKKIAKDSKLPSAGITTYEKNTITIMDTSNSWATTNSLPVGAGTLFTNYLVTDSNANVTYNRQEYWINGRIECWIRYATGVSTWSVWEKQVNWTATELLGYADTNYKTISTVNAYAASALITAYPNNRVTTFFVNGTGSTGFPSNNSGIVTTYRLGGNGWNRQDFRKYDTDELWTRHVNASDGNWSPWVLINSIPNLWVGVVAMNHNTFIPLGTTKCTNFVDFERVYSTGGNQPTLSKTLWSATEISTDSASPTIIGTAETTNLQAYRDANNMISIKYSAGGNNHPMFVRTSFC